MLNRVTAALAATEIVVAGCAQKAEDVSGSYVSPLTYQSFSCRQIQQEATRISSRAAEISGVQNKKTQSDAVATGVALVLFWPAAFFIKGDKQTAAELARLKGELNAPEQASIQKNCGIRFERAPAVEPVEDYVPKEPN